ncbi:diguanylate cyclase [Psychromonas ingrahamii 37]|uniref:diguanylate cyclase n=1 Tax=Psychromonas ingrahamii (strain DSM 17664 / CCUG 51855 / 37) TaxID=357804 RepID=A1SRL2_PSYIN|nr:diguanylate cyclase [Psychromonas ingrahamii]ABM02127.1 diguanylate cyclase [Psychromonas ingrahamii 37]
MPYHKNSTKPAYRTLTFLFTSLLVLLFFLLSTRFSLAESTISLKQVMQGQSTDLSIYYLEDPEKSYNIDQLQSAPLFSKFQPLPNGKSSFGISSSDYWLKIIVRNTDDTDLLWLLEIVHQQWDHVNLYINGEKKFYAGDHIPFTQRAFASENNVFEITTAVKAEQQLLIHFSYEQAGQAETQIRLWTVKEYSQYYANRYFIIGAMFGLGIILFFYNLFIGYSTRLPQFLWYSGYIISALLAFLTDKGFGYRYLWSNSNWFSDFSPVFFIALVMIMATQFTRSFLNTATESVNIDRLLQLIFVVAGLSIFFSLIGYRDYAVILGLLSMLTSIFFPVIGWVIYLKGRSYARFYILGWSIWSLGMILAVLQHIGMIPVTLYSDLSTGLCFSIEAALLSFALADRFNQLRNEKEEIELIHIEHLKNDQQLLEQLVTERTEELEQAKDRAELLARTDPLTNMLNRRAFFECGSVEIKRSLRYKSSLAIMMIDLDHFKSINDNYGHAAGDNALLSVANTLKAMIRNVDIIGRIGGEEFAVIIPHADLEIATELAQRLRLGIEKVEIIIDNQPVKITACFGVTSIDIKSESLDEALKRADKALYLAKENGRNRVEQLA